MYRTEQQPAPTTKKTNISQTCETARYLGDGVYARYDEAASQVVLTTFDGIEVTNTIYLEDAVLDSFTEWLRRRQDVSFDG